MAHTYEQAKSKPTLSKPTFGLTALCGFKFPASRCVKNPPPLQPGEVRELCNTIHPKLVPRFRELRDDWTKRGAGSGACLGCAAHGKRGGGVIGCVCKRGQELFSGMPLACVGSGDVITQAWALWMLQHRCGGLKIRDGARPLQLASVRACVYTQPPGAP
eukprot:364922-Chlamydomonas_euryale.AAC.11